MFVHFKYHKYSPDKETFYKSFLILIIFIAF